MQFYTIVTLIKLQESAEDSIVIGQANIDLYPLCSNQIEKKTSRLSFESDGCVSKNNLIHRKISCSVEFTSDQPILEAPIENCLYVTIDSLHNVDLMKSSSRATLGFMAPLESQVRRMIKSFGSLD